MCPSTSTASVLIQLSTVIKGFDESESCDGSTTIMIVFMSAGSGRKAGVGGVEVGEGGGGEGGGGGAGGLKVRGWG